MATDLDRYKNFIDGLLRRRSSLEFIQREIAGGDLSRLTAESSGQFLLALPAEQRADLARWLGEVEKTVVHDVLCFLYDEGYSLSKEGSVIALDPLGNPPYYDFMGRAQGADWSELEWEDA